VKLPRPNEKSGPLAGHVKKGRTYRSVLAATGGLRIADWVRDDGNVELASAWVDQLYALIRISLQILGTEEKAVENAFAWLDDKQEEGTSGGEEVTSTDTAE
jgi:hypothetical protein